jgi:hypothetical protein
MSPRSSANSTYPSSSSSLSLPVAALCTGSSTLRPSRLAVHSPVVELAVPAELKQAKDEEAGSSQELDQIGLPMISVASHGSTMDLRGEVIMFH